MIFMKGLPKYFFCTLFLFVCRVKSQSSRTYLYLAFVFNNHCSAEILILSFVSWLMHNQGNEVEEIVQIPANMVLCNVFDLFPWNVTSLWWRTFLQHLCDTISEVFKMASGCTEDLIKLICIYDSLTIILIRFLLFWKCKFINIFHSRNISH